MHGCNVFLGSVWCWIADAKWNVLLGALTTVCGSKESVSGGFCWRYSSVRALMLWVSGLNVEEVEELDGDQVADVCGAMRLHLPSGTECSTHTRDGAASILVPMPLCSIIAAIEK